MGYTDTPESVTAMFVNGLFHRGRAEDWIRSIAMGLECPAPGERFGDPLWGLGAVGNRHQC